MSSSKIEMSPISSSEPQGGHLKMQTIAASSGPSLSTEDDERLQAALAITALANSVPQSPQPTKQPTSSTRTTGTALERVVGLLRQRSGASIDEPGTPTLVPTSGQSPKPVLQSQPPLVLPGIRTGILSSLYNPITSSQPVSQPQLLTASNSAPILEPPAPQVDNSGVTQAKKKRGRKRPLDCESDGTSKPPRKRKPTLRELLGQQAQAKAPQGLLQQSDASNSSNQSLPTTPGTSNPSVIVQYLPGQGLTTTGIPTAVQHEALDASKSSRSSQKGSASNSPQPLVLHTGSLSGHPVPTARPLSKPNDSLSSTSISVAATRNDNKGQQPTTTTQRPIISINLPRLSFGPRIRLGPPLLPPVASPGTSISSSPLVSTPTHIPPRDAPGFPFFQRSPLGPLRIPGPFPHGTPSPSLSLSSSPSSSRILPQTSQSQTSRRQPVLPQLDRYSNESGSINLRTNSLKAIQSLYKSVQLHPTDLSRKTPVKDTSRLLQQQRSQSPNSQPTDLSLKNKHQQEKDSPSRRPSSANVLSTSDPSAKLAESQVRSSSSSILKDHDDKRSLERVTLSQAYITEGESPNRPGISVRSDIGPRSPVSTQPNQGPQAGILSRIITSAITEGISGPKGVSTKAPQGPRMTLSVPDGHRDITSAQPATPATPSTPASMTTMGDRSKLPPKKRKFFSDVESPSSSPGAVMGSPLVDSPAAPGPTTPSTAPPHVPTVPSPMVAAAHASNPKSPGKSRGRPRKPGARGRKVKGQSSDKPDDTAEGVRSPPSQGSTPAPDQRPMGHNAQPIDPRLNLIMLQECQLAVTADEDGDLPLHIAVVQGEIQVVQRLLGMMRMLQASVDHYNKLRQTPLHLSVITKNPVLVTTLLHTDANPNLPDRKGQSTVHLAIQHGSLQCLQAVLATSKVKVDLDLKNYDGISPLHLAVQQGDQAMTSLLLTKGADVDVTDGKSGRTPLFYASENKNFDLCELLIEHQANVNIPNYSGNTPVQAANSRGYADIVALLVKHGADTNSGSFEGTQAKASPQSNSTSPKVKKALKDSLKDKKRPSMERSNSSGRKKRKTGSLKVEIPDSSMDGDDGGSQPATPHSTTSTASYKSQRPPLIARQADDGTPRAPSMERSLSRQDSQRSGSQGSRESSQSPREPMSVPESGRNTPLHLQLGPPLKKSDNAAPPQLLPPLSQPPPLMPIHRFLPPSPVEIIAAMEQAMKAMGPSHPHYKAVEEKVREMRQGLAALSAASPLPHSPFLPFFPSLPLMRPGTPGTPILPSPLLPLLHQSPMPSSPILPRPVSTPVRAELPIGKLPTTNVTDKDKTPVTSVVTTTTTWVPPVSEADKSLTSPVVPERPKDTVSQENVSEASNSAASSEKLESQKNASKQNDSPSTISAFVSSGPPEPASSIPPQVSESDEVKNVEQQSELDGKEQSTSPPDKNAETDTTANLTVKSVESIAKSVESRENSEERSENSVASPVIEKADTGSENTTDHNVAQKSDKEGKRDDSISENIECSEKGNEADSEVSEKDQMLSCEQEDSELMELDEKTGELVSAPARTLTEVVTSPSANHTEIHTEDQDQYESKNADDQEEHSRRATEHHELGDSELDSDSTKTNDICSQKTHYPGQEEIDLMRAAYNVDSSTSDDETSASPLPAEGFKTVDMETDNSGGNIVAASNAHGKESSQREVELGEVEEKDKVATEPDTTKGDSKKEGDSVKIISGEVQKQSEDIVDDG